MGKFEIMTGDSIKKENESTLGPVHKTIIIKPHPIYFDSFWGDTFSTIIHSVHATARLSHELVTDRFWTLDPGINFKIGDRVNLEVVMQDGREIHNHTVVVVQPTLEGNIITLSGEI